MDDLAQTFGEGIESLDTRGRNDHKHWLIRRHRSTDRRTKAAPFDLLLAEFVLE